MGIGATTGVVRKTIEALPPEDVVTYTEDVVAGEVADVHYYSYTESDSGTGRDLHFLHETHIVLTIQR